MLAGVWTIVMTNLCYIVNCKLISLASACYPISSSIELYNHIKVLLICINTNHDFLIRNFQLIPVHI